MSELIHICAVDINLNQCLSAILRSEFGTLTLLSRTPPRQSAQPYSRDTLGHMQQRSTRTLYSYWNEIRGARSTPERRDIDPTRIRDALAHTFILESQDGTDFFFRLAGSHICATYCRELKNRPFQTLWSPRDHDAIETLMRAVTEDHAVALVTFEGQTERGEKLTFELALFPLRHNGVTTSRMMGSLTALDTPYWLGIHPIMDQKIAGLRLIWPDDRDTAAPANPYSHAVLDDVAAAMNDTPVSPTPPMPATVAGNSARRYAHLSVIDGGKS